MADTRYRAGETRSCFEWAHESWLPSNEYEEQIFKTFVDGAYELGAVFKTMAVMASMRPGDVTGRKKPDYPVNSCLRGLCYEHHYR